MGDEEFRILRLSKRGCEVVKGSWRVEKGFSCLVKGVMVKERERRGAKEGNGRLADDTR